MKYKIVITEMSNEDIIELASKINTSDGAIHYNSDESVMEGCLLDMLHENGMDAFDILKGASYVEISMNAHGAYVGSDARVEQHNVV